MFETYVKNLEMVTYWFLKSHLSLLRNVRNESQFSRHFGTVGMLDDISVHGFYALLSLECRLSQQLLLLQNSLLM